MCRKMDADLNCLSLSDLEYNDLLVADHGRCLFRDDDIINFVTKPPLTIHVCDLCLRDGAGGKLQLGRMGAMIGLSKATTFRTRRTSSWYETSSSQDTFNKVGSITVTCTGSYQCRGRMSVQYIRCGRKIGTEDPQPA